MSTTSEFRRYTVNAPAAGSTVTVRVTGRYVAIEDATYNGAAGANLFSVDSTLNGYFPVIENGEFSFKDEFSQIVITGGTDGGSITFLAHDNPCAGYFAPDFKLHPLAGLANLEPFFIIDADFSYRSHPEGVDIQTLYDTSGQNNHFSYNAGGYARKIAGGAASGDAHTINFPNELTSYHADSDLIRRANTDQPVFILVAMDCGPVVGPGYELYGQGYGDNSASLRIENIENRARLKLHGANVLDSTSRSFHNGFNAAVYLPYFFSNNYGANVRWNALTHVANQYPIGGGLVDWQVNDGTVSTLGKGNQTGIDGLGNADFRLGFIGAWGYENPNYTNEPLQYVADVYGITLGS